MKNEDIEAMKAKIAGMKVKGAKELEEFRISMLGKKGEISQAIATAAESLPSVIEAIRGSKKE